MKEEAKKKAIERTARCLIGLRILSKAIEEEGMDKTYCSLTGSVGMDMMGIMFLLWCGDTNNESASEEIMEYLETIEAEMLDGNGDASFN